MNIPPYKTPTAEEAPWTRPEAADVILQNSGAVIRIGGDKAFYSPATDHIQLPPEHAFRGPPELAATALHEARNQGRPELDSLGPVRHSGDDRRQAGRRADVRSDASIAA